MTDTVQVGTVLIEDGTHTPDSASVTTNPYSANWSHINSSSSAQLGRKLETAGWTFFYLAGEISMSGFGRSDQSRTDHAIAHVIHAVEHQHCNCLEITQMSKRSFLGLPYTSIVAHARHIQKSRFFHEPSNAVTAARLPHIHSDALSADRVWENEGGSCVD